MSSGSSGWSMMVTLAGPSCSWTAGLVAVVLRRAAELRSRSVPRSRRFGAFAAAPRGRNRER